MSTNSYAMTSRTVFGHPAGLFTLFFAEMWERFSYYGMRALLLFYMLKGFLGYGDSDAYAIYGSYTALVYLTPFFGGILADRILGARRAVILGGLLMAAGHLMMTVENTFAFFSALALLIAGNGFFKPNISTIVGSLYPEGSPKRDGGFTIFYMGINLGAAMSPLLCGYIGETYGWHYGFGLATIGMLLGIAVFVAPSILSQLLMGVLALAAAFNVFIAPTALPSVYSLLLNLGLLGALAVAGVISLLLLDRGGLCESQVSSYLARIVIAIGAVFTAVALVGIGFGVSFRGVDEFISSAGERLAHGPENPFALIVNVFIALALLVAAVVAWFALSRGGLPKEAGAPNHSQQLRQPVLGGIPANWVVYIGALASVPVLALIVSGLAPITPTRRSITLVPESFVNTLKEGGLFLNIAAVFLEESSKLAGLLLWLAGIAAFGYVIWKSVQLDRIPRQRMYVVLILTFFSMLFWAFFEQAGSSVNNFTDRNVDRVFEERYVTAQDVGKTITFRIPQDTSDPELSKHPLLSQEQFGYKFGNDDLAKTIATAIRNEETRKKNLKPEKIEELANAVTKDKVFTLTGLMNLRDWAKNEPNKAPKTVDWQVTDGNVGMGVGGSESPATIYQALNPVYILLFGIVFSALWTFLGQRGLEPSTPVKFALGLLQLGLGFGAFWYGAYTSDARGMVGLSWLFLGYLLHTTGELCISPVGLSMVTKMAPSFLVSTVMGLWFLATAFSQFLAAIIAQFTGVGHGGEGGVLGVPPPSETVHVYGGVFGTIAIAGIVSAGVCLLLSPVLSRWMHEDVRTGDLQPAGDRVLAAAGVGCGDGSEQIQDGRDKIRPSAATGPGVPDTNIRDLSRDE